MKEVKEKMSRINARIGNNIVKVRIAAGISGRELGQKIYVSQQQICKYELGKGQTPVHRLVLIAEALSIDLSLLLEGVYEDMSLPSDVQIRKRLYTELAKNFAQIKDVSKQNYIHKKIKELVDNQELRR